MKRYPSGQLSGVIFLAAVCALALAAQPANAQVTRTWDNDSTDGMWGTAANWNPDGDPAAADTAVFNLANEAIDLGGITRQVSVMQFPANFIDYTFNNGTLDVTEMNFGTNSPTIHAAVTDQGDGGLLLTFPEGTNLKTLTMDGQITISSTASDAFKTSSTTDRFGTHYYGSTTLLNSVAGGVEINDQANNVGRNFQGNWTIGGDFKSLGRGITNLNSGTYTIGGNLVVQGAGKNITITGSASATVGGDVIIEQGGDIYLMGKITSVTGDVKVLDGALKIRASSNALPSGKTILLGDTSGTTNASILAFRGQTNIENDITVQAGGSGTATIGAFDVPNVDNSSNTISGAITLGKDLIINANQSATKPNTANVTGQISGVGGVTINGNNNIGTVVFSNAANDYAGDTTVRAGTFKLQDNAGLTFYIGENGVNNAIKPVITLAPDTGEPIFTGGTVTLNGDFHFDLTSAGASSGDSWNIVDMDHLTATFGPTFSVDGFTRDAGSALWTGAFGSSNFEFSELTGVLTVAGSSIVFGDVNGDLVVDAADYIALKMNMGSGTPGVTPGPMGDLDDSGVVDVVDLQMLITSMGGATDVVPEPASLGLLALGALAIIRRRRSA